MGAPRSLRQRASRYTGKGSITSEGSEIKSPKVILPFFLPALSLIIMFVIFPVLQTIYISFFSPAGDFAGLENYYDVLSSREILNLEGFPKYPPLGALIHNLIWILIHLPLSLFSGLALAIILRDVKGASVVKSIIFLGMVTPLIVGGIMLRFTFDKQVGILNGLLTSVGLENLTRTWTADPETGLFAEIFGGVWLWTGFSMILYSAGLATIPRDYFEAAKIDGASPFRTFYRITLPLLRPVTQVIMTMTILWELKIFDLVYIVNTQGGPGKSTTVLALEMYLKFASRLYNQAAVIATFLTLLTLIVAIGMVRYMVKK